MYENLIKVLKATILVSEEKKKEQGSNYVVEKEILQNLNEDNLNIKFELGTLESSDWLKSKEILYNDNSIIGLFKGYKLSKKGKRYLNRSLDDLIIKIEKSFGIKR